MKKQFLISALFLSSSLVAASDLSYSWAQNSHKDMVVSIGNNTGSSHIQINSVVISVDDNVCLDQTKKFTLSPQLNMPQQALKLNDCFMLKSKSKFAGVTDMPDSLAITSNSLIGKDVEVTTKYTLDGIDMEKNAYFSLLFIK